VEAPASGALLDPTRLAALRATALLDSPPEETFDRLTRLASHVLGVPVALVSLVTEDRQFFKSCFGLPEPWSSARETPLSHSFCQHAVETAEPLVVEDTRVHPLVNANAAITDLDVIAYAGFPLVTAAGEVLGTFCAIDHKPRIWTDEELGFVREMAASAMTEIELRTAVRELEDARAEAAGTAITLRELQRISDTALAHLEIDDLLRELLARVAEAIEADAFAVLLHDERSGALSIRAGRGVEPRDEPSLVELGEALARDPGDTTWPLLVEADGPLCSLLGLPLAVDGHPIGLLGVGARSSRRFSPDEVKLLELAAERAAYALHNARLYERAQSDAEVLERRLVESLTRRQAEAERAANERGRLLAHVVEAQEEERRRIAFDVHDDYLQAFTAVRMHLERLAADLETSSHRERALALAGDVAATTDRMRGLVFDLRPPALDWAGIASALRLFLEEGQRQWGLAYRIDNRLEAEPPAAVRVIVYRIAQEAITNVRKHANASQVEVDVSGQDGGVLVRVRDDGDGIAQRNDSARPRSFGLAGMRERAETAGGWWRIESAPGQGTSVEFWIPARGEP
jgi:signal transduction histidine kinase